MSQYNPVNGLHELQFILSSKAFHTLLSERKQYAQEEVNRFVREQNMIEAYGALRRMEDIDQMVEIIKKRITEIEKETK